jgi:hypothetical protein
MKYIDNEVLEFKNIAKAEPKYYHSMMHGPALTLQCEVLGCYSWGRLPYLLSVLGLTTGSHPFAAAVTVLGQLYTQLNPQASLSN